MGNGIDLLIVAGCLAFVIFLYFHNNSLKHSRWFMWRRFINWFPLGMTYAFLYMGRYNLNAAKIALGTNLDVAQFGYVFGAGTTVYGLSFLLNGPLVDRLGGKRGILIAAIGAALMNLLMGGAVYLFLHDRLPINIVPALIVLYSLNMYFQSYGAVSIIKNKAYWFHVRERGLFGAIFGTLISFGAYFAFDWGNAIVKAAKLNLTGELSWGQQMIRYLFAVDLGMTDAVWLVFTIPAGILIFWALMDSLFMKDSPAHANLGEFDPHDASSDEEDEPDLSVVALLKRIFSNPILLTIALIEFTSGVLRNGIMQWYNIFTHEVAQPGGEIFSAHWGLFLALSGIAGGFAAGVSSDKIFHSRRGPPAALLNGGMVILLTIMAAFLFSAPFVIGLCAVFINTCVIGVHSIMSGTAAADFGGRKVTATAMGVVDGFVYLGTGLQSVAVGNLVKSFGWQIWPIFLLPFAVVGLIFGLRMWHHLPAATRRYLMTVENVSLEVRSSGRRLFGLRSIRKTVISED